MKIAIVAPSGVPFRVGGAENLWWGLLQHLNQYTYHQADLIKVPSPELGFWELIDNYRNFSTLNLSHFDFVISGKYPSWMIQHPNHVCYMLHKLRGLYDTYPASFSTSYSTSDREITQLQKFMSQNQGCRRALNEFYERVNQIRSHQENIPQDAFQFPGPLIREMVHFLDGIGLAPDDVKKYAAISYNVAKRKDYFPVGYPVAALYPPPIMTGFWTGKNDYLFTVSRLEQGSKRVGLLIEAMKYVKADIQFKIGGTGSDLPHLKELAGEDPRIVFLGFVNDTELVDLYANSMATLYIPFDEDYGLVTVEAMMSGKPVITCTDSGGTNEFVQNGETGYSVPPDPKAIAEKIDYLCGNPNLAAKMGENGKHLVSNITWENVVDKLLDEETNHKAISSFAKPVKQRLKITAALTFPVYPPRGGGQNRVFHLYRHLAKKFDVELVTFTDRQEPFQGEIAPGLWETRIPMSAQHRQAEADIRSKSGVLQITDVVMPQLYHLTPAYVEALRKATTNSSFIVASHPYLLPAIQKVAKQTIWYEAHNVESELKKTVIPPDGMGGELLKATYAVEKDCCQLSELIMVCANRDVEKLEELYGVEVSRCVEVPNGVDLETVNYVPLDLRLLKKKELGFDDSFVALFIGSWHNPNVEAVNNILEIAKSLPEVCFLVVGSVGMAFPSDRIPNNVSLMGIVDDETKDIVLGVADVALNPMTSGSGTNLKMLDYLGAGVPIISTHFGARGLYLESGKNCIVTELEKFSEAISNFMIQDNLDKTVLIEQGRKHAEENFDWEKIAQKFIDYLGAKGIFD
jgi:glycosyltransferase involved in cell wall biosynthesis